MYRGSRTTHGSMSAPPRSQQRPLSKRTYRTEGSEELRQRMNGHWDQGRLLVSCDLAFTATPPGIGRETYGNMKHVAFFHQQKKHQHEYLSCFENMGLFNFVHTFTIVSDWKNKNMGLFFFENSGAKHITISW